LFGIDYSVKHEIPTVEKAAGFGDVEAAAWFRSALELAGGIDSSYPKNGEECDSLFPSIATLGLYISTSSTAQETYLKASDRLGLPWVMPPTIISIEEGSDTATAYAPSTHPSQQVPVSPIILSRTTSARLLSVAEKDEQQIKAVESILRRLIDSPLFIDARSTYLDQPQENRVSEEGEVGEEGEEQEERMRFHSSPEQEKEDYVAFAMERWGCARAKGGSLALLQEMVKLDHFWTRNFILAGGHHSSGDRFGAQNYLNVVGFDLHLTMSDPNILFGLRSSSDRSVLM
jgi:hypothetical protein